MKKVMLLLILTLVQITNAQTYKELQADDITIVRNEDKDNYSINILKKDKTVLPTGYYKAPFEMKGSIISFYVAPNGKLNQTAKLVRGDSYSLIPIEDNIVNGKISGFSKNTLLKETVFEHGLLRSAKEFDNGKLVQEETFDNKGDILSEMKYKNDKLISDAHYKNGKAIIKKYENSVLVSQQDELSNTTTTYYKNGKTATSSTITNEGNETYKEFGTGGNMLQERLSFGNEARITTKYFYPNGKLKSVNEDDGVKISYKEYNSKGVLTKSEITDAPVAPTMMISN